MSTKLPILREPRGNSNPDSVPPSKITSNNTHEGLTMPQTYHPSRPTTPIQPPQICFFFKIYSPFRDMAWKQPLTQPPKKATIIIIIRDDIYSVFIMCQASSAMSFVLLFALVYRDVGTIADPCFSLQPWTSNQSWGQLYIINVSSPCLGHHSCYEPNLNCYFAWTIRVTFQIVFWLTDNLPTLKSPKTEMAEQPLYPAQLIMSPTPFKHSPGSLVLGSLWDQGRLPRKGWPLRLHKITFSAPSHTDYLELQNNPASPPPGAFPEHHLSSKASSCVPLWYPVSTSNRTWP